MKISIKKIINPELPTIVLLILVCLLIWFFLYLFSPIHITDENSDILFNGTFSGFMEHTGGLSFIASIILAFFNGFLIAQLNNKYTLIRNRTFLPVLIFLFMLSSWTDVQNNAQGHISTTFFLFALYLTFGVYRNRVATESAFGSSLMMTLSGFFVLPVLFLLPVFWIGMIQLKGFSLKTFLASLLGLLAPCVVYFSLRYYLQPDLQWIHNLEHIQWGFSVTNLPLIDLIYLTLLLIIGILNYRGLLIEMNKDSLQTRAYLIFLNTLLFFVFVLSMLLPGQYRSLTIIATVIYSILISHPLTLRNNNFQSILFYVFCLVNLSYLVSKLIIQP